MIESENDTDLFQHRKIKPVSYYIQVVQSDLFTLFSKSTSYVRQLNNYALFSG